VVMIMVTINVGRMGSRRALSQDTADE